ncbi:BLUF domain-containing protein [Aliikangiella sp. IMCC44653]
MKPEPITQYAYISLAIKDYSSVELTQMLKDFRASNEQHHISGLLIYCGQSFFQLFEGAPQATKQLWENIQADNRHQAVELVFNREVDNRMFFNWTMAFQQIAKEDAASIYGLNALLLAQSEHAISDLLSSNSALSSDLLEMIKDFSGRI